MTTAADREGLRERLTSFIMENSDYVVREQAQWRADALIAGPLAETLTQADTAAQAVAERDEARAECERLRGDLAAAVVEVGNQARARGEAEGALRASELAGIVDNWRDHAKAAQADVARLSAEVEARDKALKAAAEAARADSGYSSYQTTIDSEEASNLRRCRDIVLAALAAGQDKTEGDHG